MTRDEHRDRALGAVKSQAKRLPPEGDWAPVMLLDPDAEDGVAQVVEVPSAYVGTEIGQVLMATGLRDAIMLYGLVRWATVFMAYVGHPTPEQQARGEEATDHAECVVVLVGSSDAPHDVELWRAQVYRRPRKPPHLGPWERGTPTTGLMFDPFVLAMKSAADDG